MADKQALAVFDFLVRFSGYSFNKAHSVSYAYLAYWTVYLKTHFPKDYMASLLSMEGGYYDKKYICGRSPKWVFPAGTRYEPERARVPCGRGRDTLRAGCGSRIGTGIGDRAAAFPPPQREFHTFPEWLERMQAGRIKRPVLEAWIAAGACDRFGLHRKEMISYVHEMTQAASIGASAATIPDFTETEKERWKRHCLVFLAAILFEEME